MYNVEMYPIDIHITIDENQRRRYTLLQGYTIIKTFINESAY